MNQISSDMVDAITFDGDDDDDPEIYLTSVGANFSNDNPFGCANGVDVKTVKKNTSLGKKCSCVNRDHQYSVSKQKTAEGHKILCAKKNYKLEAGK